jgi:SAM-dependent methyltransferase
MTKVVVPNLKIEGAGAAFVWDHRFQSLGISFRCGHNSDIQSMMLQMQPMLAGLDVRAEELRSLASELEHKQNMEDISMPDLCKRAIDTLDLKGKSVLDIGSYDGKTAGYALERGAASATVMDSEQWRHYGWPEPVMPEGVEYVKGDFRDTHAGSVDVVFCFNVIYHVEDPHLALRALRETTTETMLLCTLYVHSDLPVWRVYEPRELNPTDETVFWGPSASGLEKSLKVTGWSSVQEIGRTVERIVLKCNP